MDQSKLAWELLCNAIGKYQGRGVNHEKQDYTSDLMLSWSFPNKTLSLISMAKGDQNEIYHHEKSLIGFDSSGALALYVVSNNHPTVTPHIFDRMEEDSESKKLIFRHGDFENRQSFREEITVSVYKDNSIAHHYAWGIPGGNFAPRSGSKMMKLESHSK